MTPTRRTDQDRARRRDLADAAAGWLPERGDLAYDTEWLTLGVVTALPEDTDTGLYQLVPEGGGAGWTAPADRLAHPDSTAGGTR
ncbi:hypothetical protein MTF65_06800 [Streptomyces sp. APSN-46.1]|uniref:hypothetical protein n=1 Tax=Streptomyces sp. APSN-46.1 TaxID=2929049 RepID=UPI001FB3CFFE|nr:hypothetical protein [Streptomyces sp. APSN-46.1]MCJ1677057.1 hypothetical protein [Streptomyces sp. APSN-46.1]